MRRRLRRLLPIGIYSLGIVAMGIAVLVAAPRLKNRFGTAQPASQAADSAPQPVRLVAEPPDTLRLEPAVAERMQLRTAPAQATAVPDVLELSGTLILDANHIAHIHPRFAGEVVEIGLQDGTREPVDFGAKVHKGQLLAVVWSRDLGEKKSELVDAVSQLILDRDILRRLSETSVAGAVPERTTREAQHKVDADEIAVSRVIRTLQTWRISDEEIRDLRAEAERLGKPGHRDREELVHRWARVDIRASIDGTVMERNVTLGDLADTSADLFILADLSRLRVVANAYEENLPSLDRLTGDQRQWSIRVPADNSIQAHSGGFDRIGPIIDPNQHSALVMGWVDNPAGRLRVGQFVMAAVPLPPVTREVAIPMTALIEQGNRQAVFVQSDGHEPCYTRRRVAVVRRAGDTVYVRAEPSAQERAEGILPLAPGEKVVVSGAVQLTESLSNLQSMALASHQ